MPPLSGLSSTVQAMGNWLPWYHSGAPSHNDNRLTTNNEEFRAHRKSSYGDSTLSPVSIDSIAGPSRSILADWENSEDEDDIPAINDLESLKKGIVKTSKNSAYRPYTILLVGETGAGKSSLLEFIANVLNGNDTDHYNFDILDRTNEHSSVGNLSRTNAPRLYEFTSKNGVVVRIHDNPGLADTRSMQQDELHKRIIATHNKQHFDSINAVLVLANGTVPRVTVGTDNALSTLSDIFPSMAHNVSLISTNVLSPLHRNFFFKPFPPVLRGAPQFALNNPIALQREYLKVKDDPNMMKGRADLRKAVKASEQRALQMLVVLFDWLDSL